MSLKRFYENGATPFLIGTTGHRNPTPEAVEALRESIRTFLRRTVDEWKKRTRPDSNAPILLLDGLAEGADWLVADVALELKKSASESPLKLVATIPFPVEIYEEDFASPETLAKFRSYWNAADERVELPLTPENEEARRAGKPLNRDEQYRLLGEFLATNSIWLIALWDGVCEGAKTGGTADVVRRKLAGRQDLENSVWPLDSSTQAGRGFGAVCQIATPRGVGGRVENPEKYASRDDPFVPSAPSERDGAVLPSAVAPGERFVWTPRKDKRSEYQPKKNRNPFAYWVEVPFDRFYRKFAAAFAPFRAKFLSESYFFTSDANVVSEKKRSFFSIADAMKPFELSARANVDCARLAADSKAAVEEAARGLLPVESRPRDDGDWAFLLDRFGYFDVLAGRYQNRFLNFARRYLSLLILTTALFCVAIYCYPLQGSGSGAQRILCAVKYCYLASFFCLIWYWRRAARSNDNARHRRYRALAEALRFQLFWNLGGVDRSIMDYYWNGGDAELDSLRAVLNSILTPTRPATTPNFELARELWALAQRDWFAQKIAELREHYYFWNAAGLIFSFVALIWSGFRIFARDVFVLCSAPGGGGESLATEAGSVVLSLFFVGAACSSVLAAGCFLWNAWHGYLVQRFQYEKMVPIYDRAIKIFDRIKTEPRFREKAVDWLLFLGKNAQEENADWFSQPRKLELPR